MHTKDPTDGIAKHDENVSLDVLIVSFLLPLRSIDVIRATTSRLPMSFGLPAVYTLPGRHYELHPLFIELQVSSLQPFMYHD